MRDFHFGNGSSRKIIARYVNSFTYYRPNHQEGKPQRLERFKVLLVFKKSYQGLEISTVHVEPSISLILPCLCIIIVCTRKSLVFGVHKWLHAYKKNPYMYTCRWCVIFRCPP